MVANWFRIESEIYFDCLVRMLNQKVVLKR
nr:MAG TPA: hypothetical protein [Caudoviricetes sp.]